MELIKYNDTVLAIIVRNDYNGEGIHFFTPPEYSQQLAYMHHPEGHEIMPHVHNAVSREVKYTNEVLIIKKGMLECDFYTEDQKYLESRTLNAGDIILLISGGHGFKCMDDTVFFEIKQGPYAGENDKTRFKPSKNQ